MEEGRYWPKWESRSWTQRTRRGGRRDEPSETGASTTWPHPIVRSRITRLVIVSSCLMSLADSGHVSGKKRGAGNCENSENARLICKGNEVDIKHGYCSPLNPPRVHLMHRVSFKFPETENWWNFILSTKRIKYVNSWWNVLYNRWGYVSIFYPLLLHCFH